MDFLRLAASYYFVIFLLVSCRWIPCCISCRIAIFVWCIGESNAVLADSFCVRGNAVSDLLIFFMQELLLRCGCDDGYLKLGDIYLIDSRWL